MLDLADELIPIENRCPPPPFLPKYAGRPIPRNTVALIFF
jgi:hypothetical protein